MINKKDKIRTEDEAEEQEVARMVDEALDTAADIRQRIESGTLSKIVKGTCLDCIAFVVVESLAERGDGFGVCAKMNGVRVGPGLFVISTGDESAPSVREGVRVAVPGDWRCRDFEPNDQELDQELGDDDGDEG